MRTFLESPITGLPFKRPNTTRFRRAIYGIFIPSGECLYVGQTMFPKRREKLHKRSGKFGKKKFWLAVFRWAEYPKSHRIEGQVIQSFKKRGQARFNVKLSQWRRQFPGWKYGK